MAITAQEASLVLRDAARSSIRKRPVLLLAQGGLVAAAGVVAALAPLLRSAGAVDLLAWLLIIAGGAQLISVLGSREAPTFWLRVVAVVLFLLVGLLLLLNPLSGLPTMTLLLLVLFVATGMERIVFALTIKPMAGWQWVLGSGALAIVCGLVLYAALPRVTTWLLGVLLGACLLGIGGAEIWVARRARGGTGARGSAEAAG